MHPAIKTTYVLKQKLCGVTVYDTITVTVWKEGLENLAIRQFDNSTIRQFGNVPHPTTNELTVQNAKGCELVFYDVVGREVLKTDCQERTAVIDISQLGRGIYLVHVIDTATGAKLLRKLLKE